MTPQVLPNFLIPGTQKCGTTTLYHLLKQHPSCFMPEEKEPMYLAYRDFCPTWYRALLKPADAKQHSAIGEASTSYLMLAHVPERILSHLGPKTRFIVLLRDPVQRLLSSYLHMFKRGHEHRDWNLLFNTEQSLAEALASEIHQLENAEANGDIVLETYRRLYGEDANWNFRYLNGSCYSRLLSPYLSLFPKENFLFLFLENLEKDPSREIKRAYRFLELDDSWTPENLRQKANVTHVSREIPKLKSETRKSLVRMFSVETSRLLEIVQEELPPHWLANDRIQ